MRFGLTEAQINEIWSIMAKFPEISQALIFGSRAMGNYKEASDVDIALKGDTTFSLAAKVKYELEEETYLPFFFDVLPYEKSNHVKLKEHIDRYGIPFYRAGWKECTLGEIANIQTGPFGSQLHASDYVKSMEGWLCGTGCLKIDFQSANVLPRFMAYYFSTRESKSWLTSHAVGTTMPNLNSKILRKFPISLPPMEEQKAIAAVLSSLDDKIDLLQRQNKTLEAMAQTLLKLISISIPPEQKIMQFNQIVSPLFDKKFSNRTQIRTLEKLRDTLLPKLISGAVRVRY